MILHKDRDGEELGKLLHYLRNEQFRIGMTNGVFDILHPGHLQVIDSASRGVDYLIVGLNSDESVKKLKKSHITIQDEMSRAKVLVALKWVDSVVIYDEETPCNLLELIQPDVHFKGGDYDIDAMPETPIVRKHGGVVRLIPLLEGYSTTKIIQRIAYAACPTIDSCPVRHGVGPRWFPDICPDPISLEKGRRVLTWMEEKAEEELQRIEEVKENGD